MSYTFILKVENVLFEDSLKGLNVWLYEVFNIGYPLFGLVKTLIKKNNGLVVEAPKSKRSEQV